MKFKKLDYYLHGLDFKNELSNFELWAIRQIAHDVLGFNMDKFSYHSLNGHALYAYNEENGRTSFGLNIIGFKMSKSELYLFLEDIEANEVVYILETD